MKMKYLHGFKIPPHNVFFFNYKGKNSKYIIEKPSKHQFKK